MKTIDFPDDGVVTMLPIDLVSFLWVASAAAFLFVAGAGVARVEDFIRGIGERTLIALKDRLYHPEPKPILAVRRSHQTLPPDESV